MRSCIEWGRGASMRCREQSGRGSLAYRFFLTALCAASLTTFVGTAGAADVAYISTDQRVEVLDLETRAFREPIPIAAGGGIALSANGHELFVGRSGVPNEFGITRVDTRR